MARNTKRQKKEPFNVEGELVRSGVQVEPFDILLRFNIKGKPPEVYIDADTKLLLDGLIEHYGEIVVKVNWFTTGLAIIAPNTLPSQDDLQGV